MTDHYDVERTITSLGIGEALVTVLSPKGVPTPLAATRLHPAGLADGAAHRAGDRPGRRGLAAPGEVRDDGRPRERPRDHHGPARGRAPGSAPGRGAAGRRRPAPAAAAAGPDVAVRRHDPARVRGPDPASGHARRRTRSAAPAAGGRARAQGRRRARRRRRSGSARRRSRRASAPPAASRRSRVGQSILRGVFDTIFGGGRR